MRKMCMRVFFAHLIINLIWLNPSMSNAQTVSFNVSALQGENVLQPTSIQFGPDGRLYVAQQNGKIFVYTVVRNGLNDYKVTATEEITHIQQIPNHNDNGTPNPAVNTRQVTGILVKGTAQNPVIYVTSSDPRIGGGFGGTNNSKNLDTNSGVISKLTWNGMTWVRQDLVRGLPRSEENHSPNGLQLDEVNNILYMAQGGNTNMGAPSNNFIFLPEYALSTAILAIDLNAIGTSTYDLPTLDDEDRPNVGPPGYEDFNDPFGGNKGKNQAILVPGGPVQVYSPGWRNNYDLVITKSGKMYSFDNGPNAGWGGPPINCSNQVSEPGSFLCDALHYVPGPGYYAGFPNPTRANRNNTYNTTNPQSPVPPGMENPVECNYVNPSVANGALSVICSSVNGISEYTASNFNNAMKGNLLAAAFNGNIYRFVLNASGTALVQGGQSVLAANFGTTPLDLTAQGDNDIFPGTIWAVTYGSNGITVFEPNDFASCNGDPNSFVLDDDGDGYSNGDETLNETDKCSAASIPPDFDKDFLSDLIDPDDDNDGINDTLDFFARDSFNGLHTNIPVLYSFNNVDNGGIAGYGFTGIMSNGLNDYMDMYDLNLMTVGGAALKFSIADIPDGDALGNLNNQKFGYQFGVNTGAFPFPFEVQTRIMGPFAGFTPVDYQSMGMYIGTGDQDNYLKIVCASNGGSGGIQVMKEVGGVYTSTMYNVPILGSSHVNLFLTVDPATNMVQPAYTIDGSARVDLGSPLSVPASWIEEVMAVGFIATSRGSNMPFAATWDYIGVTPVSNMGDWVNVTTNNTCTNRHENAFVQTGNKFYLLGGRGVKPVEIYDYVTKTWSTGATPPVVMHHFQAVELNGLIYVVGAFTGNFPNEPALPNVYIYDPVANQWHVGPEIPAARRRGSAGAVVHDGKIYLISGLTNGHVSGWVPWTDSYNPSTNEWTVLADAPRARDHFHAAIHNGNIYALAGRQSGNGGSTFAYTIPESDVYNIATNQWNQLPSPEADVPTQRAGASVAVLGDEILVIGGESMSQNSAHKQTEALNVNSNQWRALDEMNTGRHGTQAIVNNFGVYICAGSGNRGGTPELNSMEAFYLYGQTQPVGSPVIQSVLAKSATSLAFSSLHLGFSETKFITLTNTSGNQGIIISSITKTGDVGFTVNTPYTTPIVLQPGESINVNVTFMPLTAGNKTGTLVIQHGGSNGPTTNIPLTGTGIGLTSTMRINAGGGAFTAGSGDVFSADNYFSTGTHTFTSNQPINNTTDDLLYQTERYGNYFSYNIPVNNGNYTVKLHFAEIWSGAMFPGVRVFDVVIEGDTVLSKYDIYADAGGNTAIVKTFTNIPVNDQALHLQFIAKSNNAKICAIEVSSTTSVNGVLAVVPNSVTFPELDINTASTPVPITISNTGTQSLTVTGVNITGAHANNFSHNFSSNIALNPGQSSTVNVTFTPTAAGTRLATMSFNHTGSNNPVSVSLSGTGKQEERCGWYVENNGLVVIEVESEISNQPGWTMKTAPLTNYTGAGYYEWTGPNYYWTPGNGVLTYYVKITNGGRYRFRLRSYQPGPTNTDKNDIWVRFPDKGAVWWKNGAQQDFKTGWFKVLQNNIGVWTFNTWAGEGAFYEIYADFPEPGIYAVELSGRANGFSIDRLILSRQGVSDWAATHSLPAQSAFQNCPVDPLVWYRDKDKDLYGNPNDSVLAVSKPVGYVSNNLDCDDNDNTVYPGAPEILDGKDNNCNGIIDEGVVLNGPIAINAGGNNYTSVSGELFLKDRLFTIPSGGFINNLVGEIYNTDDDPLYRSERNGTNFKYYFQADPGMYRVTLHFAEIWTGAMTPGVRRFHVDIEEQRVLDNFDIFATHGFATAAVYTFETVVTDGMLDIEFTGIANKAKVSGLKVEPIPNTPPAFTVSGNVTVDEDFTGTRTVTVTPAPVPQAEQWQTVTYSLSPASVSFANVSIDNTTGLVTISAVPDANGSQLFTITANDGQMFNNIATQTFTLTVNPVNDPPIFTLSGDVEVDQNFATTEFVNVFPGPVPADEVNQVVTYSLSPATVAFANVSINAQTGMVTITSVANAFGMQQFTVTANDGQAQNNLYSQNFMLTVNQVNSPPTINAIANMTIQEDAAQQIVNLTGITPGLNDNESVTVTAISDNVALIPHPVVSYSNPNTSGTLSFQPLPDMNGVAIITVTVDDGFYTVSESFTVTVLPVNDAPAFTLNTSLIEVDEDFTTTENVSVIPGFVPADEINQVVTYSLSPASVSFANISINQNSGVVTITAIADANGSQLFTLTADDGQSQNNLYTQQFTLIVNPVNDAPEFTLNTNLIEVNEDFTTTETVLVIPGFVPADEMNQVVTYSLSPASVSFANVSIDQQTGMVTITAIANANGSQQFTITADDGQSVNNLYAQQFTLIVNPVNDAPEFTLNTNLIEVDEDFTTTETVLVIPGFVPADEMNQVVTYSLSPASVSFANVSINQQTGMVTISAVADGNGTQVFTITANDGQTVNNLFTQQFTLIVHPVNDAPAFTLNTNLIEVDEDFTTTETVFVIPGLVPADEINQVVTYSLSPASVSFANVSINQLTGMVTITAIANANGSQQITITADDGQSVNNLYAQQFTLIVNPVNDAPEFTLNTNLIEVDEDFTTTETVLVIPGFVPVDEMNQVVTYSLSPASVSFANVSINQQTGMVTITAIANANGSQIFTITADDGQSVNNLHTQQFTLIVKPVNDAPEFTLSTNLIEVDEDFTTTETVLVIPGFVPADEMNQVVTYSLSPASVSFANVSINQQTGMVTITAVADVNGTQVFTITADDGQAVNNLFSQQFTLFVHPVNDAPAFTLNTNLIEVEEDFTSTEMIIVTPAPVPTDEVNQVVTYSLSPASVSFAQISFNSNTGEVVITSIADANGSQLFTITANDGQSVNNLYAQQFTLIVNPVNDAPAFTLNKNLVEVDEDFTTPQVVYAIPGLVPVDEAGQVVTYSISPSTVSFANIAFNSVTGEVIITAIANANGSQVFTITADDGQSVNNLYTQQFTLIVNPVNNPPVFSLNKILVEVDEDFTTTETVVVLPGFVPADEMNQVVTYTLSPASVSFANISIDQQTGMVTITAVADGNGSQVFTITADDGQTVNNLFTQQFTLIVNPVNDAPAFTLNTNLIEVEEDFTSTEMIIVTPAPVPTDEVNQVVTYSLSPASVSFAQISFNSNTGEVAITAIADANGSQLFTITADDGQSENNLYAQQFTVIVHPVNDAPAFTLNTNLVEVNEDFTTTETVLVIPAPVPADELAQNVSYSLSPSSVSFANVSIHPFTGTVTITAVADSFGTQVFTITADDGQTENNLYSQQFTLMVYPVNDAPTLNVIADLTVNEDSGPHTILLTGITAGGGENQPLNITVNSDNPALFASMQVNYNSPATNGTLILTLAPNMNGVANVTVTVDDGQSMNNTFSQSFVVTVLPVNDPPVFTLSNYNIVLDEDFPGTYLVNIIPAPVPADEINQTVTYSLTPASVGFANVVLQGNQLEIRITAVPNGNGSRLFTLIADDGQAQNNLHVRTFTLTVNPVNDPPVFTVNRNNIVVLKNFTTTEVVTVTPAPVPADEVYQVVNYSLLPSSVSFADIAFNPSTGSVSITSIRDEVGAQLFTITANDGMPFNNLHSETFMLTVVDTNYQPTIDVIADMNIDEDAGLQTVQLMGITAGFMETQTLTITATSDNPVLIPHPAVQYNNPDSTGTLTFAPAADRFGVAVITVTVIDGQPINNTFIRSFTVTVNPVNDPPTLDVIADKTINEDAGLQTVVLTGITAGPFESQTLTVTAVSNNPSLIPNPVVNYTSPDLTGALSFAPLLNQYGVAIITVTVDDGEPVNNIFTRSFTVTVLPVNDEPVVSDVLKIGQEDKSVGFHENDFINNFLDVDGDMLVKIQVRSLPAHGNLLLNGAAVNVMDEISVNAIQQLIYDPLPDYFGVDSFLWNGSDGLLYAINDAYVFFNIQPVNDRPEVIGTIPDIEVDEDAAPIIGHVFLGDIFYDVEDGVHMTYTVQNTNPGLTTVTVDANYMVNVSFMPDAWGTAEITIRATDSEGAWEITSFNITVNSVPDAPRTFQLLTPENKSIQSASTPLVFSWEASDDADGDPLVYSISIKGFGLDTLISGLNGTQVIFEHMYRFTKDSTYRWMVTVTDGMFNVVSDEFTFKIGEPTSVLDLTTVTGKVLAYPNPFTDKVFISYELLADAEVTIRVYNFIGQLMTELVNEKQSAGVHQTEWNGREADGVQGSSGIYFYEILVENREGIRGKVNGKLIKH